MLEFIFVLDVSEPNDESPGKLFAMLCNAVVIPLGCFVGALTRNSARVFLIVVGVCIGIVLQQLLSQVPLVWL